VYHTATEVNQLVDGDATPAAETATSRGRVQTTWSRPRDAELQVERHVRQRHTELRLLRRQQGDTYVIHRPLGLPACASMCLLR